MATPGEIGPGEPSDDELMLRLAAGDGDAFRILVERHHDRAWQLACRSMADRHEAEDLVQATFLRLLEARERYRAGGTFPAYLRTVLVRLAMDWQARSRPEPRAEVPEPVTPEEAAPDAVLIRRERSVAVHRALLELPADQRLALLLRSHEGCRYAEIAGILGVTEKAVEMLLHRARLTLLERLEDGSRDGT